MKISLIILLSFLQVIHCNGQEQLPKEKDAIAYLIRTALLSNRDSGGIVLVPLATENIKNVEPQTESKYWPLLQSYFPNTLKDSLKKMVASSPWIDPNIKVPPYRIFFPPIEEYTKYDLYELFIRYRYEPVFSISNIIYAKNNTVCIVYVTGYQQGAFAVEIKKDKTGKWASHEVYTDILE
jgi:hypothetical protein